MYRPVTFVCQLPEVGELHLFFKTNVSTSPAERWQFSERAQNQASASSARCDCPDNGQSNAKATSFKAALLVARAAEGRCWAGWEMSHRAHAQRGAGRQAPQPAGRRESQQLGRLRDWSLVLESGPSQCRAPGLTAQVGAAGGHSPQGSRRPRAAHRKHSMRSTKVHQPHSYLGILG